MTKKHAWIGPSNSEQYLQTKESAPNVSPQMANSVSQYRKEVMGEEVKSGLLRDGSAPDANGLTSNSFAVASVGGLNKTAQVVSAGGGGGYRGGNGDSVKQSPEVYSPLWMASNLNLPRDRATINAWCRSFYALNPYVRNAINLHSTYPISKLNIKCPNKDIEKFFNDMIEEIDLMNVCVQIAQEYWLLGEAFPYAELDENQGKWSRIVIQNPDYMVVQRTVIADEPNIMLRADENLKKIVFSNKPSDIEQRKQLNQHIIESIKRSSMVPLDNFNISHLALRISPYEIRGTGLPVCIFRPLMLFDKLKESKYAQADNMVNPLTIVKIGSADFKPTAADLEAFQRVFECHDEETEVLTNEGFKKFNEVISYEETYALGKIPSIPKNIKIACLNPESNQLEYHQAEKSHVYNYYGDMYHFANEKIDIKVTPNHDMWVSEKEYQYYGSRDKRTCSWSNFKKIKAKDVKLTDYKRFQSKIDWTGSNLTSVKIGNQDIPIELYLEFLGYLVSEGCLYTKDKKYTTNIVQSTKKFSEVFKACADKMSASLQKSYSSTVRSKKMNNHSDMWIGVFSGKEIYEHFKNEIGDARGNVKSYNKCIPRWILDLSPKLQKIMLDALVLGDGSSYIRGKNNAYFYYTTSKQLADDVYEMVYKCGFVPTSFVRNEEQYLNRDRIRKPLYTISWSTTNKGNFPLVYKTSRHSQTKQKNELLSVSNYNGKVWCFTVPTGLFITRRNGKITIQGNSAQYDKDFKIFTHEGVSVEVVGRGQGIYDISGDITQAVKEIYVGLQVPSVLMDGGADTTYANGGVALDVLRQRYMQFRNMLSAWLKRKIFAPISKIQGFYEYNGGEKQLIIPDIEWNHMSLFDAGDYINNLVTLTSGTDDQKRASLHTLYRSMGMDYQDEVRRMRVEAIQNEIAKKEKMSLGTMPLNELRALNDDTEIPEPEMPAGGTGLPGEVPGMGMPGDMGGMPGGGMSPPPAGLPGLDLGAPPAPPTPA